MILNIVCSLFEILEICVIHTSKIIHIENVCETDFIKHQLFIKNEYET